MANRPLGILHLPYIRSPTLLVIAAAAAAGAAAAAAAAGAACAAAAAGAAVAAERPPPFPCCLQLPTFLVGVFRLTFRAPIWSGAPVSLSTIPFRTTD